MDRKQVSERAIAYLARKHGTTVEEVREMIRQTGSTSRKQVDAAFVQQYEHPARALKGPRQ